MAKFDMREYARRGATVRASELTAELAEIYRAFPDLRRGSASATGSEGASKTDGRTRAARAARLASATGSRPATTTGRRRRMSPAARKAVSERMRRYWAQRRKAKSAG